MAKHLAAIEKSLHGWRWAQSKSAAMREALAWPQPASFTIKVEAVGHFSSSSTYNQTHAPELDAALAKVVANRLPDLLIEAEAIMAEAERITMRELAEEALRVVAGGQP